MLNGATLSARAIAGTAVLRIVVSSDSMKKPTATNQGSSRLAVAVSAASLGGDTLGGEALGACQGISRRAAAKRAALRTRQRGIDDDLRLAQDFAQVRFAAKTFGVNLVDILGAGGPCGEPAAGRTDLDAADGSIVSRRVSENLINAFTGQFGAANLRAIDLAELLFLFRRGARIDSIGERLAQIAHQRSVALRRIAAGA